MYGPFTLLGSVKAGSQRAGSDFPGTAAQGPVLQWAALFFKAEKLKCRAE